MQCLASGRNFALLEPQCKGAAQAKADGPLIKSDEVLFASIRDGVVTPGKPLSMPAKGGNPSLTDKEIKAVVEYLRTTFGT